MKKKLIRMFAWLQNTWSIIGITLLLFVCIEFSLSFFYKGLDWKKFHEFQSGADTYTESPWVNAYFKELSTAMTFHWRPYVCWRGAPHSGEHINIDNNGVRKTWNPDIQPDDPDVYNIFLFGGSPIWGWGARDDFTIPSLVSKILFQNNIKARITNFGQIGYVTSQEVICLIEEIKKGNIPDLVIFYNGFNDIMTAGYYKESGEMIKGLCLGMTSMADATLITRVHKKSIADFAVTSFLADINNSLKKAISPSQDPNQEEAAREMEKEGAAALSGSIIRNYRENIKIIETLSKKYSFQPLFYLQPAIFEKKKLSAFEQTYLDTQTIFNDKGFDQFYMLTTALLKNVFQSNGTPNMSFDISSIFNDNDTPIFIDAAHLGETGNAYIARELASDLLSHIRQHHAASPPSN
ncbi:MAG: hypothetical protein V6Z89_14475 [Desulfobacter sp.]